MERQRFRRMLKMLTMLTTRPQSNLHVIARDLAIDVRTVRRYASLMCEGGVCHYDAGAVWLAEPGREVLERLAFGAGPPQR